MHKSERELFVISDLHVGGRYGNTAEDRGFRINTHVGDLAQFVRDITEYSRTGNRQVELIINGDFVDFLAQEGPPGRPWRAFIDDPVEAVQVFDQIVKQDRDLFVALHDLLAAGVDLTLVLGNHDVELSLPSVRWRLSELLEARAGGRLHFVYDGEAYVMGNVVIEHGNRYDGFNVVDHDRLRRLRSAHSRRQAPNEPAQFFPPPGSLLVEQVMNPIKKDYCFIDLLKPETQAVIPLLIALEPGFAGDIERLWRLWRLKSDADKNRPVTPGWPTRAGHIGTLEDSTAQHAPLRELLGGHVDQAGLERLLKLAEGAATRTGSAPQQIGIAEDLRWSWSLLKLSRDNLAWNERRRILLDALRTLQTDRSFDPTVELPEYLDHAKHLSASGFGVMLFGHTHLAKEVPIEKAAIYINTGTWADLIRVPIGIFDPVETTALSELDRFVEAVRQNRFQEYLHFDPTFAHVIIDRNGKAISARLRRSRPGGLSQL